MLASPGFMSVFTCSHWDAELPPEATLPRQHAQTLMRYPPTADAEPWTWRAGICMKCESHTE